MLTIVIVLLLLRITYEDVRYRAILLIEFPVLAALLLFVSKIPDWFQFSVGVLYNMIYILFLMSVLTLYLSLRRGRVTNVFNGYFGSGDLLFFVVLAGFLEPVHFILFLNASLILSMVFHILLKRIFRTWYHTRTVPLAGFQALCFAMLLLIGFF